MVISSVTVPKKTSSNKLKNLFSKNIKNPDDVRGNVKYVDIQLLEQTVNHRGIPSAKPTYYQRISCNTLMIDGFQANKLKRPTNRYLSTNLNNYKKTPTQLNCSVESSLSCTQKNKSSEQVNEDVNKTSNHHHHQQQLQRQKLNSCSLPRSSLSLSSSSSLSSFTLKGSRDSIKLRNTATKLTATNLCSKDTLMKNNEKDSNKSSKNNYDLLNAEDILSSEMSTVFMKDDSVKKQTILCYEQMNLKTCPIIDSNEICHFLSLQYNQIHRIVHLHHLTKLVYLNISNNQLTTMNGLETLYSLRILLLGNNQIKQICALNNLYNLNVLDLNHNQIQIIENLTHLKKLYCLNLSFNYITTVNGLSGLISLTELNLKHNNILLIEPIDNVPKLIWIFLSFNHIKSWSQISGLTNLNLCAQVTLDGNPIVFDPTYRKMISSDKRFFKDNTTVYPLKPNPSKPINKMNMDEQGLLKRNVPISFLLENKQHFPDEQQLTTTTTNIIHELLNYFKENEQHDSILRANSVDNSINSSTENLTELMNHNDSTLSRNEQNLAYLPNNLSNLIQSNLSLWSIHSDLQYFSPTSTINQMKEGEDNWTEEVTNVNVEINSSDNSNNMVGYSSIGTLTDESILFPLFPSTKNNLLKFKYYLKGLTHLVLEGIPSTIVFKVDDDDNDDYVHKLSNVIGNDSKFEKQTNESTEHTINFDCFSSLVNHLQYVQSNNNINDNNNAIISKDDEDEDNEIERKESNHSLKLLNFNRIVKLTIRNVNWNEFINCISKLHELLPQLKELNLENNQLKYLHQVTDLIDFEYLTALHITGSNGNPIVEQSGQLWRPFIIWSLADSLNLTFLDGKLIKPNEVNESKNLFSLFYERIKMRNSYCTTSNQSFYKRLETVNNISNMMNNKIPMSDANIDDSGLRLVNSISSPTLPRTVLNSHNNNNINNNNRNIDATMATTSVHTTSTLVNCSRFVEQQNILLTKKELNNDNEVTRDNSVDSLRRSSSNKFKINGSSINGFKQNQSSIHNISPALKQVNKSENFENGLQSNEGKLSIQNQLLKNWPSILKRLIHQAITDNHIATNKL
ncbi:unnamed protein product [Schistosoma rodhaini]|uniref:Leucine-rich repeat-containing protein 49 n=3 Tax=Schistosoma rodhaini TaxID=6188 RepID=A0AA85EUF3_9TREM|nr:unnamed protein product [Schistosoma rodhaini]